VKHRACGADAGQCALSLLAADGLHVRDGTFGDIDRDKLASPGAAAGAAPARPRRQAG
jgi:hypothetical protein